MSKTHWLGVVMLSAASAALLCSQSARAQRFSGGGTQNNNSNNDNDKNKDDDHRGKKKDKDSDKGNKNNQNNNNGNQGNQNNQGNKNNGGNLSNSGNSNKPVNTGPQIQPFIPGGKDQKDQKDKDKDKNDRDKDKDKDQGKNDRDKDKKDWDKDDRDRKHDHDDNDKPNGSNKFIGPNQPGFNGKLNPAIIAPRTVEATNQKPGFWKGDQWQGSRKIDNWSKVFGNNKQPFSNDWYRDHPRAWRYEGNRSDVWVVATVPGVYSWLGWGNVPPQYQVGYNNGPRFDPSQYGEWYPLGVYSLMTGPDDVGTRVLQLAVDRRGRINGNYFDMITDSDHSVSGEVGQQSQRAEWSLNQNPNIRFRANVVQLLQPYGNVSVQLPGGDQRWQFVRLEN